MGAEGNRSHISCGSRDHARLQHPPDLTSQHVPATGGGGRLPRMAALPHTPTSGTERADTRRAAACTASLGQSAAIPSLPRPAPRRPLPGVTATSLPDAQTL